MLVIRRKAGERFMIGPNIVVTVLEFRGNIAKLGREAPWSVSVLREEISPPPHAPVTDRAIAPGQSPYFSEFA